MLGALGFLFLLLLASCIGPGRATEALTTDWAVVVKSADNIPVPNVWVQYCLGSCARNLVDKKLAGSTGRVLFREVKIDAYVVEVYDSQGSFLARKYVTVKKVQSPGAYITVIVLQAAAPVAAPQVVTIPSTCGNLICDAGETYASCPTDCHCGNNICGAGETYTNCPADCKCGNGVCNTGETYASCPADCHCGNNICGTGETYTNCPTDCKCGNGVCNTGETSTSCPGDCPAATACGNCVCGVGETSSSCQQDCPKSPQTIGANTDSDGGLEFGIPGEILSNNVVVERDECVDANGNPTTESTTLREWNLDSSGNPVSTIHVCLTGIPKGQPCQAVISPTTGKTLAAHCVYEEVPSCAGIKILCYCAQGIALSSSCSVRNINTANNLLAALFAKIICERKPSNWDVVGPQGSFNPLACGTCLPYPTNIQDAGEDFRIISPYITVT